MLQNLEAICGRLGRGNARVGNKNWRASPPKSGATFVQDFPYANMHNSLLLVRSIVFVK